MKGGTDSRREVAKVATFRLKPLSKLSSPGYHISSMKKYICSLASGILDIVFWRWIMGLARFLGLRDNSIVRIFVFLARKNELFVRTWICGCFILNLLKFVTLELPKGYSD